MYLPPAFAETDPDRLRSVITTSSAADLITVIDGQIVATRVPMLFDPDSGEHGRLIGHLARANAQARKSDSSIDALAIFNGPDGYVSPNMYPSKHTDPSVVPTWNYVTVHASGPLVLHDDPTWTLDIVTRLTDYHERKASASTGAPAWKVDDAPDEFIAKQLRAIVGFEILLASLVGKAKLSQNRTIENQQGVINGLVERGETALADTMREHQSS